MANERLPPQNLEAEQSLLGSILIDAEVMTRVVDRVAPEDFYRDINRLVYETMIDL